MNTGTNKRQRSCIVCGKKADKRALLRIVRSPQGAVFADKTSRAPGRGAYVCSTTCFKAANTTKKLERALKTKLDNEDFERIAAEVSSALLEG